MTNISAWQRWLGGAGLLVLMVLLLELLPMTIWPELFTWGYLMGEGYRVYEGIYSIYPPLLSTLITLTLPLGWGVAVYQLISYAVFIAPPLIVWVYISSKLRWLEALGWTLGVIFWQFRFEGSGVWFDHLMGVFGVLAFVWWLNHKTVRSGIMLGLALLTKQTAVYPVLVFSLDQLTKGTSVYKWLLPLVITVLLGLGLMIPTDLLTSAYNLMVEVGVGYLPRQSDQVQWPNLIQWILMGLWLVPLMMLLYFKYAKLKGSDWLVLLYVLAMALGAVSRFELFHLVPAISVMAIALVYLSQSENRLRTMLLGLWLATSTLAMLEYGRDAIVTPDRFVTQEAFVTASYLLEYPLDKGVYVLGSYDHWYPLTGTTPSTGQLFFQVPMFWKQDDLAETTVNKLLENPPEILLRGKESYIAPEVEMVLANYQKVAEVAYSEGDVEVWQKRPQ